MDINDKAAAASLPCSSSNQETSSVVMDMELHSKYKYLEDGRFFKLISTKKNGNHTTLTFNCMACAPKVKSLNCQIYSMGNLKRHIDKLHSYRAKEYESIRKTSKRPATEDAPGSPKPKQQDVRSLMRPTANSVTQKSVDLAIMNFIIK